ncbi:hypothetical protein SBOR_5229 [Sclerotinia borealis F-4128]|uniref:Uncharacterized protein n=1 Tax=Sclerotinia borealis (strain F-4128) TaxID=1432307 RepID=W9CIM4_SCLBF|nr:hypothetical protein SBOR_5229 [Sclerotinia borealis F-4128]
MLFSIPILATTILAVVAFPTSVVGWGFSSPLNPSSVALSLNESSMPLNQSSAPLSLNQSSVASSLNRSSVELVEDDQSFDQYETITRLMSSLHGQIGINEDAMINYRLGRQGPHGIDPKDLKLVAANDLGDFDEAEWVKINGKEITINCGAVDATTTGEDWALMQRCTHEETAIRRLMATFNEEGHEFFVSTDALHAASMIREGAHRCIKSVCPTRPLALSTPTAEASVLEGPVAASRTGSYSSQRTTLSTVTTSLTSTDSPPIVRTPAVELSSGRWLSKRLNIHDMGASPATKISCRDPPPDFTLSGKLRTVTRKPRRTRYTTITTDGMTITSSVPHDPNRPAPQPSVITPNWVTAEMFQTLSCREMWMEFFNAEHMWKRDIVEMVLGDLEAAVLG